MLAAVAAWQWLLQTLLPLSCLRPRTWTWAWSVRQRLWQGAPAAMAQHLRAPLHPPRQPLPPPLQR